MALVEAIDYRRKNSRSLMWEDGPFFPIDTVFYETEGTSYFRFFQTLGLDEMNTDAAVPGLNRNNVYRLPVSWSQERSESV